MWLFCASAHAEDVPEVKVDGTSLSATRMIRFASNWAGGCIPISGLAEVAPSPTSSFAADVRRFWIEPKLTINRDLILNLQYDPTSASTPINNLLADYKGISSWTITAGNFKEPFSLEQLISNNDTTFMERSLADTFAPGRSAGFAVGTHGKSWTLAAGAYGGNITNADVGRGGIAGTARATFAPFLTDSTVLHLGLAGSYRSLDRNGPDVSFATTPESFLFRTSLVDTGTIADTRAVGRLGIEGAFAYGPLRVQAEFIATNVERIAARSLSFQGGYVYAAWVINGKAPRYVLEADTATEIGIFKRDAGDLTAHLARRNRRI